MLLREIMLMLLRPQHVRFGDQSIKFWTTSPETMGNPQQDLKDKGVIDSGCSRHMTGNKSYLTNYDEINGRFFSFGGNSKGRKITRKCKIRTGKQDFEDVYFVKELKFNLFSVSQMYDKKNSVLFTDITCVVLSLDFKLTDESYVLLKVSRKDNMYSVDLKNGVLQRGLTCLFAKATSDESNLWHKRLGHVNFKTINKLVKRNLVRGLPSKLFEINETRVACQKGKQNKASWEEEKKDAKDSGNEDSEVSSTEEPRVNQEKDANINNTNNINTVSLTDNAASIEDNVVDENIVYRWGDINNLDTFQVSPVPTIRIHKDHPLNQVIRDLQSTTQTRKMTKNLEEYGLASTTLK
nr:ribonuclease H-like domain-containing protein [Tanacetum cinerariifolium]